MAGFLDNPNIPFPEYTPQQPIDAMRTVGMYKQQQFQQGIQAVQGQIDSLLGLPLAKSETQQYVKEQVGRLQSSLKQSVAGDFSDQRIINQIDGVAAKIGNDPIVQNGVQSTARIQKGMANLEQSKKDGKWSIQNEEYFNNAVSGWLSDGDVNTSFNSTYSPHVDYTDRFLKLYKETHPGESIDQDSFRVDINPATGEREIKVNPTIRGGVTPAKIRNVWNLVSSQPDVQNQLNIDGWYNFKGATPQQLATNIQRSTNQGIAATEATIRNLQAQIATNSSMNDPLTSQRIEELKQSIVNESNYANNIISMLSTNPEAAKSAMVNQNMANNLMGAYSYETMKKSPLWDASMEQKDFARKMDEFRLTYGETVRMNNWRIQKETDELAIARTKATKEAATSSGLDGATIVDAPVSQEQARLGSFSAQQDVDFSKEDYRQAQMELAASLAGTGKKPYRLNPLTRTWEPNTGSADYQFQRPEDAERAARDLLAKGTDDYINGAIQDEVIRSKFQNYNEADRRLQNNQQIINDVQQVAAPQMAKIRETIGDIRVPIGNRVFDNQDVIDVFSIQKGLPGKDAATARLDKKYGNASDFIAKNINTPVQTTMGMPFNQAAPPLMETYTRAASKLLKDTNIAPAQQFIEDEYRKRQSALVSKDVTLPVDDKSVDVHVRNFTGIANAVTQLNEGANKGPASEILSLLNKSDKGFKDNQYFVGFTPHTNRGYIGVRRGDEPMTRMDVPASTFFQVFPQLQTSNEFTQKFGSALSLGQGNSNYNLKGRAGGFDVDLPPTYPNSVKFHLDRKGDNSYDVYWWVTPKPTPDNPNPSPIINGKRANGTVPGFPQNASEAEVLEWTQRRFKDVNWLNQILQLEQSR